MTGQGNSENWDESMVRWALGNGVSDAKVAEMVSRTQEPLPDKSIADLVGERRLHELEQSFKDLGSGPDG
ncbi:Uncharacterised protein [Mycobacteroides abscessus subsp. abscessus]|uniref:hypothetical protein n=1 Tax=Mycobacteroides abscessus TaxID=36809 RepID=UPI0009289535|nr:hypothetical protein [Mycobacteroides abscessus]SIH19738.1 Uncharacterised protein [Mycobacteroides abscessus subsp. abscessus]